MNKNDDNDNNDNDNNNDDAGVSHYPSEDIRPRRAKKASQDCHSVKSISYVNFDKQLECHSY